MNDWVKQFVAETEAAAEREICKRELLVHYALMVEQQVIIGNVLADKSDNASDGLLSEETEKRCLKAAFIVQAFKSQGKDEDEALIEAAKVMFACETE
ncbi:hypothetical protein [Neisseria weaveri]|uniref:hypothetical protein n=1 Tax=Neisseria weaveri TaxID=28091 RepID=UPI0007C9A43A|nr:hypothetical protein [Neisseria weaveri]SAY50912.1 Uncharacterised protein [Neisseria weaveri]